MSTTRANTTLLDESLLVLELGGRLGAGFCGTLLAALSASVVIAETRDGAEEKMRDRAAVTVGKHSLDRAAVVRGGELAKIVDIADVLLLSSDLDDYERELLRSARPTHQVVCDITAFGHTGPLAGLGLPEPLVDALVGAVDTTGLRSGPPTLTGAPFIAMESAVYAASAVLAALRVRRRSGLGQTIDLASYDVGVNAMAIFIPLALTGGNASRKGNRHPASSPWNDYATRDGSVLICVSTDEQWGRLCAAMGRPELIRDPRFSTPTARRDNADEIDQVVGAWTADLTLADCQERLERSVIPAGPIVALDDLFSEPNIAHRGSVTQLDDPVAGTLHVMPSPIRVAEAVRLPAFVPAFDSGRFEARRWIATRPTAQGRAVSAPASAQVHRPLEGIRVLEIGMNTVAPLAAKQLGALGAEVIKIEPPTGDTNRTSPPLRGTDGSFNFAIANTDKRGVVIDLKSATGAEQMWDLLSTADVLVENLKPGSLERLGFSAAAVRERHPQLVYCSVNGFGFDSAYPGRPAFDTVIQATSGAMTATVSQGVPLKSGLSLADQLGGQFGLLSILAALDRRDRLDVGATIDLAMQECTAWATQTLWNGHTRTPAVVAPTLDGHVVIAGDRADPSSVARLTTAAAVARDPQSIAPVLGVVDVLAHPQTIARELLVERRAIDGLDWPVLESPLRLSLTPARVGIAMSRLGHLADSPAERSSVPSRVRSELMPR